MKERKKDSMSNRLAISDHHFRHSNIYRFTNASGDLVRPWAQSAQEADEMMIDAWNGVVGKRDTVYHLGDVAIHRSGILLMERLNGRKILIRGNHDIFKIKEYLPHFADIRGSDKVGRMIMTHYPIHPDCIPHWCLANVHGHTHQNKMTRGDEGGGRIPDNRYFNMCVEIAGLAPLPIEEIERRIRNTQENMQ